MKNLQKGFIVPIILVIIALLAIGGGVYFYKNKKIETPAVVNTETQQTNTQTPPVNTQTNNSPSQNNTSNWKTYTSTQYGFDFKYPSEFSYTERTTDQSVTFVNKSIVPEISFMVRQIHIEQLGPKFEFDTVKKQCSNISVAGISNEGKIINGNLVCNAYIESAGNKYLDYFIFYPDKRLAVQISSINSQRFNIVSLDQLNQIVLTFKFTK